jgi:NhaA family Na+:H+ antiporter
LFLGKSLGIFGISWLAIKSGLAKLPDGSNWGQLYGIAQMCGVGFTMSLFIAGLAFEHEVANLLFSDRLGILAGSLLSGLWGYAVLRMTSKTSTHETISNLP